MTHAEYQELHFLKVLLNRTDSSERWFTRDDLLLAARTGIMPADRAEVLFDVFKKRECINEIDKVGGKAGSFYNISDMGRWYLSHLQLEEDKDKLDVRLKGISIDNIRITRLIAIWALAIAGIGLIVQTAKVIIDETRKQSQIGIVINKEEQFLQSQADISKSIQSLKGVFFHADTSVKRIKIEK